MGKIIILDEKTANKIAAGEVVERPASVVKELCENSIDAGATSISIEIKNGGISLIKVADNGSGISKDDVEIAFEKYATSKIKIAEDLESISSMGFRGEALASISAVSKVELTTKTASEKEGSRIIIEGGRFGEREDYGCPIGTNITIKDLFFNTPARYKFLKKDYTEAGYVEDAVSMLALGNPGISFKLTSNGTLVLQTPGNNDIKACAYSIFGNDVKSMIEVNYTVDGFKVTGLAGKPEISRSNRARQMFFINNRIIKNKTISSAAEEAYKTLLQVGKYPFVILKIYVDPHFVDVNVHPTKQEVRFSEESQIFSIVYHGVKNALLGDEPLIPEYISKGRSIKQSEYDVNITEKDASGMAEFKKEEKSKSLFRFGLENGNYGNNYTMDRQGTFSNLQGNLDGEAAKHYDCSEKNEVKEVEQVYYPYKVIGTAFSTYIIVEMNQELYIIDQHAAHERVMFEKLKSAKKEGKQLSQMMLIPEILELRHNEFETILKNKEWLSDLGILFDEFGAASIKVNAVPYICVNADIKELIIDVLDGINELSKEERETKEEKILYRMACKSAVKANSNLAGEEIMALIQDMNTLENPFTCPHGRPTAIKLTKKEIEKRFGRT